MALNFKKTTGSLLAWLCCLCVCGVLGCRRAENPAIDPSPPAKLSIVAQGQILPASGVLRLFVSPGDPVSELRVSVGDRVQAGDLLAVMRSSGLHAAQLESLREQRHQAEQTQRSAIEAAELRLAAAQLRLEQVAVQATAIDRQQDLLDLGQAQVAAAQQVLARLERIAGQPQTAEFVGKLEVERQRIEVRQAELSYRQQEIARQQALDELEFTRRLAKAEVQAAETQLRVAQQSSSVRVVELQLTAAEVQGRSSELVAPSDGTILAIHVAEGEVAVQTPVMELADLRKLVCEVEINELDAGRIEAGQPATIRSRAWNKALHGTVTRKYSLVGQPQLRSLDPLAPVDYRSVTATIELDEEAVDTARDWLQLQVEVTIDTLPDDQ